jgi:uncharacterized protein DUF5995
MQAQGINDVLRILDGIIADCKAKGDPLGYFPALYRQVTLKVKQGIAQGFFANGPRMESFDAIFANRYFAAYQAFRSGAPLSKSWQVAFQSTQSGKLIILQDLLVGINAHINLDLGVAAGETFRGQALQDFHGDFDKINDILSGLLPVVEATVGDFSPMLDLLERIGGEDAIQVLDFSMGAARDDAWLHAVILSVEPQSVWPLTVQALDGKVAFLGKLVAQPRGLVAGAVALIRDTESKDVPAIIDALNSIVPAGAAIP